MTEEAIQLCFTCFVAGFLLGAFFHSQRIMHLCDYKLDIANPLHWKELRRLTKIKELKQELERLEKENK